MKDVAPTEATVATEDTVASEARRRETAGDTSGDPRKVAARESEETEYSGKDLREEF